MFLITVCVALFSLADKSEEDKIIERLSSAYNDVSNIRNNPNDLPPSEYFRVDRELAEVLTQVVAHAFTDKQYDHTDSFLTKVLKNKIISYNLTTKICQIQIPKTSIKNGERGKLCGFIIRTLYENRLEIPDYYESVGMVLSLNENPEVYDPTTKEIIKQSILNDQLNFFYADIAEITTDKDVKCYLWQIAKGTRKKRPARFFEPWIATCMLAKTGDDKALKEIEVTAKNINDVDLAWYIPLGMAYVGTKDMISQLFEMLKSNHRIWLGEDVVPEEFQLSHEAAVALSLCIKGFPVYHEYDKFKSQDKEKCLTWVKENKETYVIENKSPLYFLKKTRFKQLRGR